MTPTTEAQIMALIAQHWSDHKAPRTMPGIESTTTWADLGFDMIDVACIRQAVEETLGVDLPIDVENVESVADLAAMVDGVRGEVA